MRRFLALLLVFALLAVPAAAVLSPEDARELLEYYYLEPIPEQVLSQPTVEEIIDALGDPYTEYFTPQRYKEFWDSMSDQHLGGIGAVCSAVDNGILVQEVYENSPAQRGGLLPGDIITQADGTSLAGLALSEAVELLRGEVGTSVRILCLRNGVRRTVTLIREEISVPATTGELLEGGVGYILCTTFGDETAGHFIDILTRYSREAEAWIIDLRQNTGGVTGAAVDAAGLFCGERDLLAFYSDKDGCQIFQAQYPVMTDKPVIILTDNRTASASEAFTAALRDCGRAAVVGGRTLGKGVAQYVLDDTLYPEIFSDGDAMKITAARFFSPVGNTNHQIGILPDFPVDDQYAADVAWLLSAPAGEDTLSFPWKGSVFSVSLDDAADPEWAEVYTALLNAIPASVPLQRNGKNISRKKLAEELGLTPDPGSFPDANESACSSDALASLYTYRLLRGKGDGLLHPQDQLTRAELCQILQGVLRCYRESPQNFSDVPEGAWYAPAVSALATMGLMQGTGEGRFSPEDTLDCQQLITVMGRMAAWLNCNLSETLESAGREQTELRIFRDYDQWARPSVWLLSSAFEEEGGRPKNFLWDEPENIDPHAPATRDQAMELLYNILYYLDVLAV